MTEPHYCPEGCTDGGLSITQVRGHVNASSGDHPDWEELKPIVEAQQGTDDQAEQGEEQAEPAENSPSDQADEGDESAGSADDYAEQWGDDQEETSDEEAEAGDSEEDDDPDGGNDDQAETSGFSPIVGALGGLVALVFALLLKGGSDDQAESGEEQAEPGKNEENDQQPDQATEGASGGLIDG